MADQTREAFTSIVDSLASRRRILGGLVGGTVAGLLGWQNSDADRKRRKTGRDKRHHQQDNTPRVDAQGTSNDSPATLRVASAAAPQPGRAQRGVRDMRATYRVRR